MDHTNEIEHTLAMIAGEGCGYGDPDARRVAELKIQVLIAQEQARLASRLNWLTFCVVVVGVLNVAVLVVQLIRK